MRARGRTGGEATGAAPRLRAGAVTGRRERARERAGSGQEREGGEKRGSAGARADGEGARQGKGGSSTAVWSWEGGRSEAEGKREVGDCRLRQIGRAHV